MKLQIDVQDNATKALQELINSCKPKEIEHAFRELGRRSLKWFRLAMRRNQFHLLPKVRGPGPPLILTGGYMESWDYWQSQGGDNVTIQLGPVGSMPAKGDDPEISYTVLGVLHEFGCEATGLPARPHIIHLGNWIQNNAVRVLKDVLRRSGSMSMEEDL